MINKRTRRKCICCGTWKDVFVQFSTCLCNSCHSIIWERIKEKGSSYHLPTMWKELELEIEEKKRLKNEMLLKEKLKKEKVLVECICCGNSKKMLINDYSAICTSCSNKILERVKKLEKSGIIKHDIPEIWEEVRKENKKKVKKCI